jgi:ABC-type nitrate/sulfonate/bicarbonate transport system substrate-binding protein
LTAAESSAADKLRISYASVTGNTSGITYIAQRAGLFEKQGLDVELILITGGPASIGALLNGDVDLDMLAPLTTSRPAVSVPPPGPEAMSTRMVFPS